MVDLREADRLRQAEAANDAAGMLASLDALQAKRMTVEAMQKLGIGRVLKRLAKHSNADVAAKAKVSRCAWTRWFVPPLLSAVCPALALLTPAASLLTFPAGPRRILDSYNNRASTSAGRTQDGGESRR